MVQEKTKGQDAAELKARWDALKAAEPRLRARDAAQKLGVSEARLLTSKIGEGTTRLRCEPAGIFPRLENLGVLMALSRNDWIVHEKHGVYANPKINSNMGLINNKDIDLRLDFSFWHVAFADITQAGPRTLRSLQFFDAAGVAIHKIYLTETSDVAAYEELVRDFTDGDQESLFESVPAGKVMNSDFQAQRRTKGLDEAKTAALADAWSKLEDTHHFNGMLNKLGIERQDALRAVEGRFTRPVSTASVKNLLVAAAAKQVPIMVFVGNPGCVQIHTGPVRRVLDVDGWNNVLDEGFNLHVAPEAVAEAWVVTKPSKDGDVTSLEVFGPDGILAAQFFGARKPGIPELESWREIAGSLS